MNVSLSAKLIAVLSGTLLLSGVVLSGITSMLLLQSFSDLERARFEEEASRFVKAAQAYKERHERIANDWCNWDEFYSAVGEDDAAAFFALNVNEIAAENLDANLFLLLTPDGAMVRSYYFDFKTRTTTTPPAWFSGLFTSEPRILPVGQDSRACRTGILQTADTLIAYTACPILKSSGDGPSVGVFVSARYMDDAYVAEIAEAMQSSLTVRRWNDSELPPDFVSAREMLAKERPVLMQPLDERRAAGYALVLDTYGAPAFIARVESARDVYVIGLRAIRSFLLELILVALPTVLVLAVALRTIIVRPLSQLTAHVSNVGASGRLEAYEHTPRPDEIGVLSNEFNQMISRLSSAQEKLLDQAREIGEKELRYRVLVELAPMSIVVQVKDRICYVNSATLRLLGVIDSDALLGQRFSDFLEPAGREACDAAIQSVARQGGRMQGLNARLRHADGRWVDVEIACACIVFEGEIGVQLAVVDMTERVRLQEELRLLSQRDGLTGIANRRALEEAMDRECKRASRNQLPLSLLLIDIDHFKAYNDTYGHMAGDNILRRVAGAMAGVVHRPSDTLARFGGEEFAVVLPETSAEGALQLAEAMRHAVERLAVPHAKSSAGPVVTISVGVATSAPDSRVEVAALLEQADKALYSAKASGRNRVHVA